MTEEERKAKKRESARKWREAHPDYHKNYFEEHREEYREYHRKYYRKYKQENRSQPDYSERVSAYLSDEAYRKQGRNTIAEFFEQESADDIAQRYFKNWGE